MLLSEDLFDLIKEIGNGNECFNCGNESDPEARKQFDSKVKKIIRLKDLNYVVIVRGNIMEDHMGSGFKYLCALTGGLTYEGEQVAQYDSYEAYLHANQPRGSFMPPFTVNDNCTIFHGDVNQSAVTLHSPNASVSIQLQREAINGLLQQAKAALQADQTVEPSQREDYLAELEVAERRLSMNNPPLEKIKDGLSPMADLASVGAIILQIMGMLGF